jgi:hypothetical protein
MGLRFVKNYYCYEIQRYGKSEILIPDKSGRIF